MYFICGSHDIIFCGWILIMGLNEADGWTLLYVLSWHENGQLELSGLDHGSTCYWFSLSVMPFCPSLPCVITSVNLLCSLSHASFTRVIKGPLMLVLFKLIYFPFFIFTNTLFYNATKSFKVLMLVPLCNIICMFHSDGVHI